MIEVSLNYSAGSVARGALLNYVGITDGGEVDIERSVLLTLNRNALSHGNLSPGEYRVFIYDIGHDGMLEISDGVSYPAVRAEVEISENSQGKWVLAGISAYACIIVWVAFMVKINF